MSQVGGSLIPLLDRRLGRSESIRTQELKTSQNEGTAKAEKSSRHLC